MVYKRIKMFINVNEVKEIIHNQIQVALWECCHPNFATLVSDHRNYGTLIDVIFEDATAYSNKDPASRACLFSILQGYTSFKATLHYRIANFIYKQIDVEEKHHFSILISNRGKILSGAELHYKSDIGRSFILDHGFGTVIGETSIVGNHCYFLGGVVLGATGIANNPLARRHPKIGNNVEIGAFSRLFGNIEIGNDVFIGPHCVVAEDIPNGCKVIKKSTNQVVKQIL